MSVKKKRIDISLSKEVISTSENFLKKQKEVKTLTALIEKSLSIFLSPQNGDSYPHVKDINLGEEQLEHYRELGILNENGVRNLWIKQEFQRRQNFPEKKKKCDIVKELAAELIMEPAAVEDIIYRKKERKKQFFTLIKEIKLEQ
ncbi:MAG: hypothetical protein ABR980_08390 [Ignavibacteriaceae bacterium]|jgi:hypothetical protein